MTIFEEIFFLCLRDTGLPRVKQQHSYNYRSGASNNGNNKSGHFSHHCGVDMLIKADFTNWYKQLLSFRMSFLSEWSVFDQNLTIWYVNICFF